MSEYHILVIEDDDAYRQEIEAALDEGGFRYEVATTFKDGLARACGAAFDAMIIDRMLPDGDGLDIVTRLRSLSISTPLMILSDLGQTRQRVEGLKSGVDDYMAKGFDGEELVLRLQALLRRRNPGPPARVVQVGPLTINSDSEVAYWGKEAMPLRPKEFAFLALLTRLHGQTVGVDEIWKEVWPLSNLEPNNSVINVTANRLRGRLKPFIEPDGHENIIQNVRKHGYYLSLHT